jgi:hypothetical protein
MELIIFSKLLEFEEARLAAVSVSIMPGWLLYR